MPGIHFDLENEMLRTYVGFFNWSIHHLSDFDLHTQVANIVGRTELLSGIFFLLSLLSYQCCLSLYHKPNNKKETNKHSHQEPLINSEQLQHITPTHFSWLWLTFSILLAAVSMLCKEQGITVLGVCVAYDLFVACGKDIREFFVILKQAAVDMGWSREDASKKRSVVYISKFLCENLCACLPLSLSLSLSLSTQTILVAKIISSAIYHSGIFISVFTLSPSPFEWWWPSSLCWVWQSRLLLPSLLHSLLHLRPPGRAQPLAAPLPLSSLFWLVDGQHTPRPVN